MKLSDLEKTYLQILDTYPLVSHGEMRATIECLPVCREMNGKTLVREYVPEGRKGEEPERWDVVIGEFKGTGPSLETAAKDLLDEIRKGAKNMKVFHEKAAANISKDLEAAGIT